MSTDTNIQSHNSPNKKAPISEDQFLQVCDLISNGSGMFKACREINIATNSLYKYLELTPNSELIYTRSRALYIERRLLDRDELNEKCLHDIKHCDPKIANALQNHYRELARQIEWELSRLQPTKYGDSAYNAVKPGTMSMPERIEVVMIRPDDVNKLSTPADKK